MQNNYDQKTGNYVNYPEIRNFTEGYPKKKNFKPGIGAAVKKCFLSTLVLGSLTIGSQAAYGQAVTCAGVTPTAQDDGIFLVTANASRTFTSASLLANDGPAGNIIISEVTQPTNGKLERVGDNIVYTPNAGYRGPDKFTYTIKRSNTGAESFNGHYYEFVLVPAGIAWNAAKAAAESKTYNGLSGYLANITSAAENEFVRGKLNNLSSGGKGWIGASDAAKEGEWKWVGGPEANQTFFVTGTGTTSGKYSNWLPNDGGGNPEPNNAFGIEHYAYMLAFNGEWNDFSVDGDYTRTPLNSKLSPVTAYVIEYGTGQNCTMTATATVNLVVASATTIASTSSKMQDDLLTTEQTQLHQNYPNPFKGRTQVNFTVKESGQASLKVYNLLGQEVKTLFEGQVVKGKQYETSFEGNNLSKGVYFYTLINGNEKITKRMLME